MSQKTLKDLAKKMRDIDIAVLSTHSEGGQIAGRPMSNNRDVEYDGDSYYFTLAESRTAHDTPSRGCSWRPLTRNRYSS